MESKLKQRKNKLKIKSQQGSDAIKVEMSKLKEKIQQQQAEVCMDRFKMAENYC